MEHIIARLLQDFEYGMLSRRQLIQSLASMAGSVAVGPSTAAGAAADGQVFKATAFNHVS
jgi:hypothetical protein